MKKKYTKLAIGILTLSIGAFVWQQANQTNPLPAAAYDASAVTSGNSLATNNKSSGAPSMPGRQIASIGNSQVLPQPAQRGTKSWLSEADTKKVAELTDRMERSGITVEMIREKMQKILSKNNSRTGSSAGLEEELLSMFPADVKVALAEIIQANKAQAAQMRANTLPPDLQRKEAMAMQLDSATRNLSSEELEGMEANIPANFDPRTQMAFYNPITKKVMILDKTQDPTANLLGN